MPLPQCPEFVVVTTGNGNRSINTAFANSKNMNVKKIYKSVTKCKAGAFEGVKLFSTAFHYTLKFAGGSRRSLLPLQSM